MLKRVTAIFFILLMAGHVYAGVCGCLNSQVKKQHSCCKREKSSVDALRAPNCCDKDCIKRTSENAPQFRNDGVVKVTFKAKPESAKQIAWTYQPVAARVPPVSSPSVDHRLKYSRPPNLYLKHHAFLI